MKTSIYRITETAKWGVALSPWALFALMFGRLAWLEIPVAVYVVVGGLLQRRFPAAGYGTALQAPAQLAGEVGDLPTLTFDQLVSDLDPGLQQDVSADLVEQSALQLGHQDLVRNGLLLGG